MPLEILHRAAPCRNVPVTFTLDRMFPELALWIIPVLAAMVSARRAPKYFWRSTGFAAGLVVAPASFGLYALYFLGPFGAIFGMLGLLLNMLHGAPGYNLAIQFGLVPSHTVVSGSDRLWIDVLNGAVWAVAYGALGWILDALHSRRGSSSAV